MNSSLHKIHALGHELPPARLAGGNYVAVREVGSLACVSGQVSRTAKGDLHCGRVGETVTADDAHDAARACALNLFAQLHYAGLLDRVVGCVSLRGYVNAVPDFEAHARVIDGASDLIVAVLGERGRHARAAIGVGSLPKGFAVEVEAVFELASEHRTGEPK